MPALQLFLTVQNTSADLYEKDPGSFCMGLLDN